MSSIESALGVLIAKFGWLKFTTFAAALAGAAMMAIFRPPKTRKELFLQAVVALACSYMFGPMGISIAENWMSVPPERLIAPVHGMIGALSWGAFGGLAHLRDKLSVDPKGAIQDVKDVVQ